ncbi:MAG TPA: hypothetical protein VJ011_05530 [Steroidobacteraceae bacterium]|nr:hypothetical protein [Steroidobacteraceae bacterium]
MLILGIDPGLGGGLAVLRGGELVLLADMPTIWIQRPKGRRREYLVGELVEMMHSVILMREPGEELRAIVERQHARPGQGVSSCYSLGYGTGLVAGILATLSIPLEWAEPAAWKRAMGLPRGADKGASIELASRLFPTAEIGRKDGRAEALLLAEYGRRRSAGG